MAFFLEVFIGGLMAGMLYSLIALGFVLIYKASGVFNFAQGAMVLFAALAMARFSEWIPALLGIESKLVGNVLGFLAAMLVMIAMAWLIERLVLGHYIGTTTKRLTIHACHRFYSIFVGNFRDRKSTRLNSSHRNTSRMPSSA